MLSRPCILAGLKFEARNVADLILVATVSQRKCVSSHFAQHNQYVAGRCAEGRARRGQDHSFTYDA